MKHRMRLQNPAVLRFGAIGAFAVMMIMMNVVAAVISFILHRFNPQSRMPGPIMCLLVGLVGAFAMSGVSKPLELLGQARDLIYSWMGL